MKKSKTILALILALLLAALAGCGGPGSTPDAPQDGQPVQNEPAAPGNSGEKKTVKIFQYKVEIADQLMALADEYMVLHPEIDLQVESVTSTDYNTLLKTKFASGEAPDIFNNQGFTEFALWKDKIEDLSDQSWVKDMASITTEGVSDENGHIYGLPLYLEGYNFCYNVKLFEDAGIAKLPETLEELDAVCQQLEDAGIPAIINSLGSWYNMGTFGTNVAMAHQPDVNAFIAGLNAGTENFEDNDIFNQWVDLVDVMVKHTYMDPLTTSFSDQMSRMANGEAAITLCNNGAWLSFMDINPDVEVGYFNIPINNDAAYNNVLFAGVSTYWVVNKESASKEEAKAFLDWLVTSERGQYYLVQEFGFVSGLTSIPAPEEYVGPLSAAVADAVAAGNTLGWEWSKYPAGMTEEFGVWIQKYVSGACGRQEMLEGFTQSWQNLMT